METGHCARQMAHSGDVTTSGNVPFPTLSVEKVQHIAQKTVERHELYISDPILLIKPYFVHEHEL